MLNRIKLWWLLWKLDFENERARHAAAFSDNWKARQAAAGALGRIGDPRAVEPLIAMLKDWNKDVRQAAAGALGRIGDPRAVEPLIAVLKDWSKDVRQAAAGALGRIGDPRAVEPLIAMLKDRRDEDARRTAEEALDNLGWQPGADEASALYWIAKRDWGKCTKVGQPAVKPLIDVLKDRRDEDARRAAAGALGQIGDPRAVEPLSDVLKYWEKDLRQAAAGALGQIGDPRAVAALKAWNWNTDGRQKETIEAAIRTIFERFNQTEEANQRDFRGEEAGIQVVISIEEIKINYSTGSKTILECVISGDKSISRLDALDNRGVILYYKAGSEYFIDAFEHLHYKWQDEGLHLMMGGGRGIFGGPYKLELAIEQEPQTLGRPDGFWEDNPIYTRGWRT